MSLTSSTYSRHTLHNKTIDKDLPFHHQPSYITLSRTLTRLSTTILPLSSSSNTSPADLTPQQQRTLRDLLSPLPYQRTKTLHTIEHARTILLQLEQSAQNIKIQRVKKDVVRDLAEKRKVIRRLRAVVEELGREVERKERESVHEDEGSDEEDGETVEELLGLPPLEEDIKMGNKMTDTNVTLIGAREDQNRSSGDSDVHHISPPPLNPTAGSPPSASTSQQKQELFHLRNRRPKNASLPTSPSFSSPQVTTGTTTALSSPLTNTTSTTEANLKSDRTTQTTLTTSLLSLAQQLKAQSLAFSQHLESTDAPLLDRALAGLDSNVGGLERASQKMGLLKRMSEGEGWWGRIMLYLWIWGLWALAVALVFVGPKLRF